MSRRKEAKKVWQFRKTMRRAADSELRKMKNELEKELLGTKARAKLIALEKRIEAIEDIQAARGIFGEPVKRTENMSKRKKAKVAKAAAKSERKDAAAAKKAEEKAAERAEKALAKEAAKTAAAERKQAKKEARAEKRAAVKQRRAEAKERKNEAW